MDEIRIASGTASLLGLVDVKVDSFPTTAHFMINFSGCSYDCGFCAQARSSNTDVKRLSRVGWPKFNVKDMLTGLKKSVDDGEIHRACIQTVCSKDSVEDTCLLMNKIKDTVDIPISICMRTDSLDDVSKLIEAGADKVGLALDAVDPDCYLEIRGGSQQLFINLLREASIKFPGKISTHLIIGMGETEAQSYNLMRYLHSKGITIGLFAFTPVKGTKMECVDQPILSTYRKIQAARHLILSGKEESVRIMKDKIEISEEVPAVAFRTSGCANCNRPYYNERIGGTIYNHPKELSEDEYLHALSMVRK